MELVPHLAAWQHNLLTDLQTSGGLLIACSSDVVLSVLSRLHEEGFLHAAVIRCMATGAAQVKVS